MTNTADIPTPTQSPLLTMGEAAKMIGVDKSTLSKAKKEGKLSIADKKGQADQIDPVELMRWFEHDHQPKARTVEPTAEINNLQQQNNAASTDEKHQLELRIARLEGELLAEQKGKKAEAEKNQILQDQIDAMREDYSKQYALLTHQSENLEKISEQRTQAQIALEAEKGKGFFKRLFGG